MDGFTLLFEAVGVSVSFPGSTVERLLGLRIRVVVPLGQLGLPFGLVYRIWRIVPMIYNAQCLCRT